MTNRELLELAAKAAGITHEGLDDPDDETSGLWVSWATSWNPLTDDGDALRLAVKLRLAVDVGQEATHVYSSDKGIVEPLDTDPYAATRRAIVRAAAEIGRNMK